MLIYNLLILVILIFYILDKYYISENKRKFLRISTFLTLFIISAFRFYVGTDFKGYIGVYNSVIDGTYVNYGFEPGYDILMRITSIFSNNNRLIFVVTSFIIIGAFFLTFEDFSINYYITVFLFVTMYFYFNSFNIIRQFIAISIIFSSLRFIRKRELMKFIIFVLLAAIFHKTALIAIIIYFIRDINLSKKKYFLITLGSIMLVPLIPIFMKALVMIVPKYKAYLNFNAGSGLGTTSMIMFIILIISIHFKDKLLNNDSFNNLYINTTMIAFIFQILSEANTLFTRVSMYFYIFTIVLIPQLIDISEDKYRKKIIIGIIIFFIVFCNYLLISNVGEVVPYRISI